MTPAVSELLGTMFLVFLGDSVVANVVLKGTKGNGSGWPVITLGWMMAVTVPVLMFGWIGGAHFNPAVTLGLAIQGAFDWAYVPGYIGAQMVGGFLGAILTFIFYRPHFAITEGPTVGVFATGPAIRSTVDNLISEFMATFTLVFAIISALVLGGEAPVGFGIAAIILVLGMALGGTTGYALNPARDLSPRIAYAILPLDGAKKDPDWAYSWIPVVGPVAGGICAGLAAVALF